MAKMSQAGSGDVVPAQRDEVMPIAVGSLLLAFVALLFCSMKGWLLLYGDAVAHLHIARRIFDSRNPGISQLGGVWLPFPHLLLIPFVQKMAWWQSGLAGAFPSIASYVVSVACVFMLARYLVPQRWALAATLFFAINPGLLYLSTTAMTEPLFLALVLGSVVLLTVWRGALERGDYRGANGALECAGLVLLCAAYTRYDGWILATAAWLLVVWKLASKGAWKRTAAPFLVFTVLLLAAPLGWLAYNAHYFHDPLDFMRGPYSAKAIEARTTPPGSFHYPGWHDPRLAAMYYAKTAQVDAAAGHAGLLVFALAIGGLWLAFRRRGIAAPSLLLWVPLPFYIYSVAYGSVPIFIPQWWPHSYYNARYGMEMLPAFALFAAVCLAAIERKMSALWPVARLVLFPVTLVLILANAGVLLYAKPLVLQEALVNARTRIAFETSLANDLETLPAGSTILMYNSDHVGALQQAGIPLKQTVNEFDRDRWQAALASPAASAAYVVAIDGDAVSAAVKEHPDGLQEMSILCTTGQHCARLYASEVYRSK